MTIQIAGGRLSLPPAICIVIYAAIAFTDLV